MLPTPRLGPAEPHPSGRGTAIASITRFGLAFWMLAVHWTALALSRPPVEHRHYVYLSRLAVFMLIIAAVADKNRGRG